MRKLVIMILALCLVFGTALAVSAADPVYSDLTFVQAVYYKDGTFHQIGKDSSGVSWYYVDGVLQKNKGIVFVGGSYYYVRTHGNLATGEYYASSTSCSLPAQSWYNFDTNGCMIDPPSYPDGWEDEWASEYPFPTEPPETEPPTDPPSEPVLPDPGDGAAPDPDTVFSVVNAVLVFATDVWTHLIEVTGMWGYYFAAILSVLLLRYLLAPIFGHQSISLGAGSSDVASRHVTRQLRAAQYEKRSTESDVAKMRAMGIFDD